MVKGYTYGNKQKGTIALTAVNNYARTLIRNWLLKPVTVIKEVDGEPTEVIVPNLTLIRNRALLEELAMWNPDGNFDRVSALGMLLLFREDKMIIYNGNLSKEKEEIPSDYLGNDPFFTNNYDNKFSKFSKNKYLT
jgi:hypothetical protein